MLRVAAETLRYVPDATFVHYGPVTEGEEAYGRSCKALLERLGLRERFRFMGPTSDPSGIVRDADVVLMTSISEGLPMSILEAMGEGRPVVSTGVGGVPDVVRGCGVVAAPGDDHALAMAVVMLLRNPALAWRLGQRGHGRLGRIFNESACVEGYRDLLLAVTERRGAALRGDRPGGGMTEARMDPAQGRLIVEARLGRRPQDMLEAAVVLEAWAGVPAQRALEEARALMPEVPGEPRPSIGRLPRAELAEGRPPRGSGLRDHRHRDRGLGGAARVESWCDGRPPRADAGAAAHDRVPVGAAQPLSRSPPRSRSARRPALVARGRRGSRPSSCPRFSSAPAAPSRACSP